MGNERLRQIRMDALSAKVLHRRGIACYDRYRMGFVLLSTIAPLVFLAALYIGKGTAGEEWLNLAGTLLSFAMIILSIVMLVLRIDDRLVAHKLGLRSSIFIASEAKTLEVSEGRPEDLEWFYRYVSEIDSNDNDILREVPDNVRKDVYRQALKEFEPGERSVTCPVCHCSPWDFEAGNCQLCGNTVGRSDQTE